MIRNIEEKKHAENRIKKLEAIISSLKEELLPEREEQFKIMAKVYVKKIIELREEIEVFTGMDLLIVERKDINIHIKGPSINYGAAPISVISNYLDSFRKAMQKIYSIMNNIEIKTRVPIIISELTDFRLNAYQPGSINLSLSLPEKQTGLFEDMDIYSSIDIYFKLLEWLGNDTDDKKILDEYINNLDKNKLEKLLINILKTLPDNKNIDSIEFYGNSIKSEKKIYVNHESRNKIKEKLNTNTNEEQIAEYRGCIRELDLDRQTFLLRNIEGKEVKQIKCILNENIADDIKNYLDTNVLIVGTVKNNVMQVKYIEII